MAGVADRISKSRNVAYYYDEVSVLSRPRRNWERCVGCMQGSNCRALPGVRVGLPALLGAGERRCSLLGAAGHRRQEAGSCGWPLGGCRNALLWPLPRRSSRWPTLTLGLLLLLQEVVNYNFGELAGSRQERVGGRAEQDGSRRSPGRSAD